MVPTSIFAEEVGLKEMSYTIKKGDLPADVLFVISRASNAPIAEIMKWNPEMGLHNIFPGQEIKYYIKPGMREIFITEIGKVISLIELNQQSITQLVEEMDKDKKESLEIVRNDVQTSINQISQEIAQLDSKMSETLWFIIAGLIISISVSLFLFYSNFSGKIKTPKPSFDLEINGQIYCYWPVMRKRRFVSLEKPQTYGRISDMAKSTKSFLRNHPELIEQEIKAGRLKLKK